MSGKVILLANTDWYLWNYRLPLAKKLKAEGYEVVLVSPPGKYTSFLRQSGFRWVEFSLSRLGLNPFFELGTIFRLIGLFRTERPQIVHLFTIKPVIYGSLAARIVGKTRVINALPGLGYVFTGTKKSIYPLRWTVMLLLRMALRGSLVIFQNEEDCSLFLKEELVTAAQVFLIQGSGVDLGEFIHKPEPKGTPLVILPTRMLWDKGVAEFVEAATLLKASNVSARFALVGTIDAGNPSAVSQEQLNTWMQTGFVEWWGWRNDMPEVYASASIVCYPSYYREGMPRALLEAAACGRPIVATDIPGSREIVHNGENGLLVPVRDPQALGGALKTLLNDPQMRKKFGRRGREIVKDRFGEDQVLEKTLAVYLALKSY